MQILLPVLQLVLIAIAFGLCGYLFFSLKRELQGTEQRLKSEAEGSATRIRAIEAEITGLRKDLESMPAPAAAMPSGGGINLNKRTQALRMMRLGEGPEHIAAALSLPKKEVELLVKVQRLLLDSSSSPTT